MEYLYTYFTLLALNAVSILALSIYLIYFMIPKIYKENKQQYDMLKTYMSQLKPLSKADTLSRYIIPFYGVFMSCYCIYIIHFDDNMKHFTLSSKFRLMDKYLNKFRIFKRKNKWQNLKFISCYLCQ